MRGMDELLASVELLAGLDTASVASLAGCAANAAYTPGDVLFAEGDSADRFWIIRHGTVALEISAPGTGRVTVETLGPGSLVGWSWLVAPYTWHFDAIARDPVRSVVFDAGCLREKMEAEPRLGYQLMSRFLPIIADRMQAARLRLLDLYGAPSGSVHR